MPTSPLFRRSRYCDLYLPSQHHHNHFVARACVLLLFFFSILPRNDSVAGIVGGMLTQHEGTPDSLLIVVLRDDLCDLAALAINVI